jgi:delta 1-pyrroline-5-carboxylate dehydrogenase
MGSVAPQFNVFENFCNTINGKLTTTEKTRHGINPATGKANPEVPVSTQKDVDDAVAAAKEAFKTWSQEPWDKRRDAILAFADGLEKYENDFGKLLTQEQGKPVRAFWSPMLELDQTDLPGSCNSPWVKQRLVSTG